MEKQSIIRLAKLVDVPQIVDIYNQGIRNRHNAILDEIIISDYEKEFENRNLDEYPIFVFEFDGLVVGWISISAYRANRRAYKNSKEVSFYIDSHFIGQGIGSQLLEFVVNNRDNIKYKSLFAILVADNKASIGLLQKYGFKLWGTMPRVLEMDDSFKDAAIWGRNFE